MPTMLEFTSSAFPADSDEGEVINPDRYGRRLALFIAEQLPAKGYRTIEPDAEDWGWRVEVANAEFPLWIGCGNVEETPDTFLCFVEPSRPLRKWFRKIETRHAVEPLAAALHAVLAESGKVSNLVWTDEV